MSAPTCSFSAYHRDYAPHVFTCDLPAGHLGKHEHDVAPGVRASWDITVGSSSAAAPAPSTTEVPFDRSREQWFTGFCANLFCSGVIRGRSLDGAPAYWWHDINILDNDHDADPGDRKEP